MTGPPGRRVLRFDGRFASEGCGIAIGAALRLGFRGFRRFKGFRGEGIALRAMSMKPALRDLLPALRVILNEVKNLGTGSL